MADLSTDPRPEPVRHADGTMHNPDGWSMVLIASDGETVVAAWDDTGTFHQWEDTETIIKQLMTVVAEYQQAWGANVSGRAE